MKNSFVLGIRIIFLYWEVPFFKHQLWFFSLFVFLSGRTAWHVELPQPGIEHNPCPPAMETAVLTTGPPGKYSSTNCKDHPSSTEMSLYLGQKSVDHVRVVVISGLYSVPLIYLLVLTPIPHCFNHCSFFFF